MSLSSAINTAQSLLSNTARQTSVVSGNISNAGNENYVRRSADLTTTAGGGSRIASVSRSQDSALLREMLSSTSGSSGQDALLDGLESLSRTLGGNDYENAPATLIANLRDALQTYAADPSDVAAAGSAVASAKDVANGINDAAKAVQTTRTETDAKIASGVSDLNDLLSRFQTVNDRIVSGTHAGRDVNDALDERDTLLKNISQYVGVDQVKRSGNDVALYTKDGTTLFETTARSVTFEPKSAYDGATTGNAVLIDGEPLAAGTGANTTARGSLQGLLQLRDDVAPQFGRQLDSIANGLVSAFSESDGNGGNVAGLFTVSGGSSDAAATLSVASWVEADPSKLRDGTISSTSSATTGPGDARWLNSLVDALDTPQAITDPAGLDSNSSVLSYASDSVGWLEQMRSDASSASDTKSAMTSRSSDALSNKTGVNLDEEMSRLLDLEQSYKASAKMISTVGTMLDSLMAAVR
ncbi:flagellar hook-associated protein FlgK [Pararhizobium mangrovi]|uniref:Flagellar hook-associated protein 1 n=1 Tax=Pararhizobium mangrovi TaxID=2590452 RepID=A0A506TXW1_9HYPH|nr:flagellar hook-associated protein FlgK [Pararhizobium mangrovi]TPW26902.1 flagellar hook-associated protein FlgK [Pararhizobium mangrovi]